MVSTLSLALASVVLISAISVAGAALLLVRSWARHGVLLVLVALAAGTLMGDAFLHLIPEAIEVWEERHGGLAALGALVLAGFAVMFILEVGLRWGHTHANQLEDAHGHDVHQVQPFGWLNLAGDFIHNLIDGVVIGAAYIVSPGLGVATTIAVAAHELPQELGDFAVLLRSGMRPRKAILFNLATAAAAVLGTIVVFSLGANADSIAAVALPVIAGAFVYIAAADLIPELHHHAHGGERGILLTFFAVGVTAMALLLLLEADAIETWLG